MSPDGSHRGERPVLSDVSVLREGRRCLALQRPARTATRDWRGLLTTPIERPFCVTGYTFHAAFHFGH